MVHDQRLFICDSVEQGLLHASARQLRRNVHHGVSCCRSEPLNKDEHLTIVFNSALYGIYLIYSIYSTIPTQHERSLRRENIEMKKLTEYRPQTMTRDEQRDMNRQIFLNLPKTPTTPWGRDPSNPMTPRTVAFTQLNGGAAAADVSTMPPPMSQSPYQMPSSGQGPSRLLPFRQHYGGHGPDGS